MCHWHIAPRYAPDFYLALSKKNPAQVAQVIYLQFLSLDKPEDNLLLFLASRTPDEGRCPVFLFLFQECKKP